MHSRYEFREQSRAHVLVVCINARQLRCQTGVAGIVWRSQARQDVGTGPAKTSTKTLNQREQQLLERANATSMHEGTDEMACNIDNVIFQRCITLSHKGR